MRETYITHIIAVSYRDRVVILVDRLAKVATYGLSVLVSLRANVRPSTYNMTTKSGGFGVLNQLIMSISEILDNTASVLTASRLPDALCVGVGSSQSISRGRLEPDE